MSGMFGALMLLCTLQTSPRAALGAALLAPRSFCCTRQGRGSKEALPNGAGVSRVGLGALWVSWGSPRAAALPGFGAQWALASVSSVAAPAAPVPSCPGTQLPMEPGTPRGCSSPSVGNGAGMDTDQPSQLYKVSGWNIDGFGPRSD